MDMQFEKLADKLGTLEVNISQVQEHIGEV